MDEKAFLNMVNTKARELGLSPLLLLSGIEGIYSFKDVPLNETSFQLLDSLIHTLFALRIGEGFHNLADEQLQSSSQKTREAAAHELKEISREEIASSENAYLKSFAQVIGNQSPVRNYHLKALELAAQEIKKVKDRYQDHGIGLIMIDICKNELNQEGASWFN